MATTRNVELMRDAYQKLDGLGLSFGLPAYSDSITDEDITKYLGLDLKDTLREIGMVNADLVVSMSKDEMMVEDRIVYHALRRFRNKASVFFKFSTATDGKTIDKQQIPKILAQMIQEYDNEWINWKKSSGGSIWTRTSTVVTNGNTD